MLCIISFKVGSDMISDRTGRVFDHAATIWVEVKDTGDTLNVVLQQMSRT